MCVCVCLLESSWLIDFKHNCIITLIITPTCTCMCIPIHTCGGPMLQSPINGGIPAPNIAVGP